MAIFRDPRPTARAQEQTFMMADDKQQEPINERATKIRRTALLPSLSSPRYDEAWEKFILWKEQQTVALSIPNEEMLLVYFDFLADQYAASSLWTMYSMIKRQMLVTFYFLIFSFIALCS